MSETEKTQAGSSLESSSSDSNVAEFSVTEISAALKRTVEDTFGYVRVRGEISGYRGPHSSGHAYFSMKDDRARLEAVIWRGVFSKLKIRPEEGMEVIATGKLTTYPGSSKYQIVIERIEPAGIGALMALLEERRKKLAAEGLFDDERKKPLPFLPNSHRRRDIADRGRDPRYSAPLARPLSGPCSGLAGAGSGRDQRPRGGDRHRWLQPVHRR